ncbi:hypothetical protein [Eisenibacter elegans]|jgi:hypothetical protein|uniref:hypothetical protein n=1 Tax=Eisenibacter elegans TaxID=997 RepID=UPI0004172409|nr:hypothetical protein [Eisenibacter elegans]
MRIIFVKTPKNRQFNYIPRYYDPVKEDLMERVREKKREMAAEGLIDHADLESGDIAVRMGVAFERNRLRKQGASKSTTYGAGLIRGIIMLLMLGGIYITFEFGVEILGLYAATSAVGVYVLAKRLNKPQY